MLTGLSACLQSWHILSSTTLMNITMSPKELDCMAIMSKKTEKHTTTYDFILTRLNLASELSKCP